eukprot:TCONS_00061125-protein
MIKKEMLPLRLLLLGCFSIKVMTVSLDDDPSLWPGHLKPFGSEQKSANVETIDHWPSPQDFFEDYNDNSRPVLFKGLAKKSPAFTLWDDEYLKNHPGADKSLVFVEKQKKENRTLGGTEISLKQFIETYQKEEIYMVNGCPKIIRKDVLIPPPLRCEETRRYLLDAVTWFSSGGTQSVIHHDDLDNINCLFRGQKELVFVSYDKYGDFLPLDQGGYSSIDVDKVNFTAFPQVRKVQEYVRASMEAGDCLFIPYKWIHQVNSIANEKKQNVAVNIWFKHTRGHKPKTCKLSPEDATIDKYYFSELEKTQASIDGREPPKETPIEKYEAFLDETKKLRMKFSTFVKLYYMSEILDDEVREFAEENSEELNKVLKKIFDALDYTDNGSVNHADFEQAIVDGKEKEQHQKILEAETLVEDFFKNSVKDQTNRVTRDAEDESDGEEVNKRPTDEL